MTNCAALASQMIHDVEEWEVALGRSLAVKETAAVYWADYGPAWTHHGFEGRERQDSEAEGRKGVLRSMWEEAKGRCVDTMKLTMIALGLRTDQ